MNQSGIVFCEITEGTYDTNAYLKVLEHFHDSLGGQQKVALFYDGLSLHTSRNVMSVLFSWDWLPILNVAYMPQHNPIEYIFGLVKAKYRKLGLDALINTTMETPKLERPSKRQLVKTALDTYRDYSCQKIIRHCESEMEKTLKTEFQRGTIIYDAFKHYTILDHAHHEELPNAQPYEPGF